eukprot:jgi/Botrbrau1/6127/Bobra.331_2s0022.1
MCAHNEKDESELVILHFNDVYNIEERATEPIGGAARFAQKIKEFASKKPLVCFSGDAYNPSILSILTKGKQMVEVLNAIGINVACIGNHDFDYGVENMMEMCGQCSFPWLMANVLDASTGEMLGGLPATAVIEWEGTKIGFMGIVEEEWIQTLPSVHQDDVIFLDAFETGRKLAAQLREEGAEVVVALTHMRLPNDLLFAASVEDVDLVLGGHDHDYVVEEVPRASGNGHCLLVKSGTDFRDLTEIRMRLGKKGERPKPTAWVHHKITGDVSPDGEVAAIVDKYAQVMGAQLDQEVGYSAVELDGRFSTVRTKESNLGNFVMDVFREAVKADIVIMNSGSLRSDTVHAPGPIKARDILNILPMMDSTVLLEVTGATILNALENGVSQYPKLEGRFPQVSGIKFQFDPSQPAGQRVLSDSVQVLLEDGFEPLHPEKLYRLGTKDYLYQGKDGYECLVGSKVLVPEEAGPKLPCVVRNAFQTLSVLNQFKKTQTVKVVASRMKALIRRQSLIPVRNRDRSFLSILDPATGRYVISPHVDGRIICVAPPDEAA